MRCAAFCARRLASARRRCPATPLSWPSSRRPSGVRRERGARAGTVGQRGWIEGALQHADAVDPGRRAARSAAPFRRVPPSPGRGDAERHLAASGGEADGEILFHPDEAVVTAIRTVFQRFAETGSARRVWLWLRDQAFKFPLQMGSPAEIRWTEASYHAVHQVLTNPVYAGAYVYGKTRAEITLDGSGARRKRIRQLPRSQWQVVIKEHHAGYIDWQTYEANQTRLAQNTRPGPHNGPRT